MLTCEDENFVSPTNHHLESPSSTWKQTILRCQKNLYLQVSTDKTHNG